MSKSVPIRLKPKDAAQAFVEAGEEPRASDFRKPVKPLPPTRARLSASR